MAIRRIFEYRSPVTGAVQVYCEVTGDPTRTAQVVDPIDGQTYTVEAAASIYLWAIGLPASQQVDALVIYGKKEQNERQYRRTVVGGTDGTQNIPPGQRDALATERASYSFVIEPAGS